MRHTHPDLSRWPRLTFVMALTACSPGIGPSFPDDDEDPVSDTEAPATDPLTDVPSDSEAPVPLEVRQISPTFGTNAGGVELTLQGGPFTADTVVTVAGVEAETLSATPSTIVVRTRKVENAGWVDVVVTTPTDEVTLSRAYQLWEDGAGKTGLYGWAGTTLTYGYGWSSPGALSREVFLAVVEPVERTYLETWGTAIGTCSPDYVSDKPLIPLRTGADTLTLVGPEELPVPASADAPGWYNAENLTWGQLPGNTDFDLAPIVGNADWPSFGVPRIASTPPQFAITSPDFDGGRYARLGDNVALQWSGSGGDYMILHMAQFRSSDFTVIEERDCLLPDTGSYTVRGADWDKWRAGNIVLFQLGRVNENSVVLPHNRSNSAFGSTFWIAALGEIQ